MARTVSVTMFQADDGSLYQSKGMAEFHNQAMRERRQHEAIMEVLERQIDKHHFGTLSDLFIPYNGYRWTETEYERDRFKEELSSLIVKNWDALKAALDATT